MAVLEVVRQALHIGELVLGLVGVLIPFAIAEVRHQPGYGIAQMQGDRLRHGLLRIARDNPDSKLLYVGDSIDDARSARAAKIPFIGIAAPSNPSYLDLVFLFQEEQAYAIVDDINYLDEVFAS